MRYVVALSLMVLLAGAVPAEENGVAFGITRDKIAVPVTLNDVGPYPFLLDLGVKRTVMAQEVAAFLKLVADPGVAGQPQVVVRAFQIAGLPAKEQPCVVMDLSPFTRLLGTPVAGIFNGRDVAGEFTVDFGRGLFLGRATDKGRMLKDESDPRAIALQIMDEGPPGVNALVDGTHAEKFVIDTTFGGVMAVPEETLKQLGLLTADTRRLMVDQATEGIAKTTGDIQIRLKSIRVGNAEVFDPVCQIALPKEPLRLGLGFLRHFRATFNFDKKLLRLDPVTTPPLRDATVIGYGLGLGDFRDGYWTVWVAKASPAALAGIVSGDVLMEVGGKDAKDLSYADLSESLAATEGATLSVTFAHGEEKHAVTLAAATLL